jgi:multiple sugar transport system permease protein
VLIVVALFCFLYVWNDFIGPLINLTDPDQYTLALGLNSYVRAMGGTEIHLLMSAATLMILPVIVLFLLAQRTFIEGISLTGLKA